VPDELLLVETDSPFLAPTPNRGALNTPAQIANIVRFIAAERQSSPEHISQVTTSNTIRLFGSFE
ncbi:MAG: TatD family hydrolase, partial [Candidatus Nanopelagicaceae bacterium]